MQRLLPPLLLLVVVATACTTDAEPSTTTTVATTQPPATVNVETFQQFDSPELGFGIAYPDQWTVAPSLGEGLVGFSAPVGEGALTPNFNVVTGLVPDEVPPSVYYDGERAKLESNLPDVQVLEEVNVDVDGVVGRGITILTDQAGVDVGISRLLVLRDGQAWEVTFFAEATQLEQLSPLVKAIFQSFEFLP